MQFKRILSVFLILAMLSGLAVSVRAEDGDLRALNLSGYPSISMAGGFHDLYYNEQGGPLRTKAFDAVSLTDLASGAMDELLDALKSLDLDRVADIIKRVMWDWFGEVRMDQNGKSVKQGITYEGPYLQDGYFEAGNALGFCSDWRLSPIENAEKLHKVIEAYEKVNGPAKINFDAMSAPAATLLAYLDKYGTDHVASVVFNISMHNGSSIFGEIAKKEFVINPEALAYLDSVNVINMTLDASTIQPWMRGLFEPGLLSVLERFLKLASKKLLDRVYDEIIIPLIFMMPGFWTYVPRADINKAKKALLGNKPEYAGLIKQIDEIYELQSRANHIIQKTAETAKVAVWAGYNVPMLPIGANSHTQSDGMLDTKYASLGANCAAPGMPFLPFYKQRVKCGHNHISADRLIDASTCLLPEQTWFAKNKPHVTDFSFGGWRDWFLATPYPTVHLDKKFPQFMEKTEEWQFIPLEAEMISPFLQVLRAVGLYLLRIWRWLLLLPLFWVDCVT